MYHIESNFLLKCYGPILRIGVIFVTAEESLPNDRLLLTTNSSGILCTRMMNLGEKRLWRSWCHFGVLITGSEPLLEKHRTEDILTRCESHVLFAFFFPNDLESVSLVDVFVTARNTKFPLRISLLNVNKSAENCGFIHIY